MRPSSTPRDPLQPHPLAATSVSSSERQQRDAYAAPPTPPSPPRTPASTSPPSSPTPAAPIARPARAPPLRSDPASSDEVPFVARRARHTHVIIAGDDPLSDALRARERACSPPPPPAGAAYAPAADAPEPTAVETPAAAPLPPRAAAAAAAAAGRAARAAVRVHTARDSHSAPVPGVFVVSSARDAPKPDGEQDTSSPESDNETPPDARTRTRVSRNVADFVWLEQRLRARYDGVIVPHLPPMALRGRLIYGFAYETERVRGLERFLAHVVAHPVLSRVEETTAFLGDGGPAAWTRARNSPLLPPPAAATIESADDGAPLAAFKRWGAFKFWQAGRRVNKALVWFLNRDSQETERFSAEQKSLERLGTYVKQLQNALRDTRVASRGIADVRHHTTNRATELQRALHTLGDGEGGAFGALLRSIQLVEEESSDSRSEGADSADGASSVGVDITQRAPERALEDLLRDYEVRAGDAQRLVALRGGEREAYEHAVEVYAQLRARWELSTSSIWDGADASRPPAADGLYSQIVAAADTLAAAQREYQRVDRSTNDELRRLRAQLHAELLAGLRDVAHDRARSHAALRDAWLAAATAIDAQAAAPGDGAELPRPPAVTVDS